MSTLSQISRAVQEIRQLLQNSLNPQFFCSIKKRAMLQEFGRRSEPLKKIGLTKASQNGFFSSSSIMSSELEESSPCVIHHL